MSRQLCEVSICFVLLLAAAGFAQQPATSRWPRLDYYGDPLPVGAVARLGTKRLQTKGGFGWTEDGKSLAALYGDTLYFWDLADCRCRQTLVSPVTTNPFGTSRGKLELANGGQQILCTGDDGAIATWNLATSQTMLLAPDVGLATTALHPGGKQFVQVQRNGDTQFRDFATGKVLRTVELAGQGRAPTVFSPDGKTLALARDSSIHLLDVERGGEPVVIDKARDQFLYDIGFVSAGRLYSIGTKRGPDGQQQNQLLIWDLTRRPPSSQEFPLGDLQPAGCRVAFSPDGTTLATVHHDRILIWDVEAEKIVRTIEGPRFRNPMHALLKIDPTSKYVAVDDRQNYVRLWELATGKPVHTTEAHHQAAIYAADWSKSGERIATGDYSGEVRVWDAASGEPLVKFRGPEWGVFALRYTPDATRLVICGDQPGPSYPTVPSSVFGPVRWHDAASGKQLREEPLAARARLLAPSPDGNRLAVATYAAEAMGEAISSPAIHLVDSQPGDKFGGHFNLVGGHAVALIWAADGKSLFTATWPKGVVLKTDASTLQPIAAVELPLKHAVFLRGGAGIITASELPEVYGWKLPGGEKQWTIKIDDKGVRGLAVSPNDRILACLTTADKGAKLRLYDLSTRRLAETYDLSPDYAERAFFSPDGSRLLVAVSGGSALEYDVSKIK